MITDVGVELYHTGLAVADLDEAMASYSASAGLEWTTPMEIDQQVWTPDGPIRRRSRFTISIGLGHHVELSQPFDGPQVDHFGYWVLDLKATMARLESSGWPCGFRTMAADGGIGSVSFHQNRATGRWVELVDARVRRPMEVWMAGGDFDAATIIAPWMPGASIKTS